MTNWREAPRPRRQQRPHRHDHVLTPLDVLDLGDLGETGLVSRLPRRLSAVGTLDVLRTS